MAWDWESDILLETATEIAGAGGGGWHMRPVMGRDGSTQLFDLFIEGRWIGSRRTREQCFEALTNAGITPARLIHEF